MSIPRLVIAGTHSGAGKTSITMALIQLLTEQGLKVQPFKAGPDYIDPSFHSKAAGRICHNLDTKLLSASRVRELFSLHTTGADLAVTEGVMGLYDGAAEEKEKGRTSHLAKVLKAPVILVIDARSMAQSAGAVALGYKNFDRNCPLKGFILNRIGSERHYNMCREAIENATGLPVLGYLPKNPDFAMPERHLGLIPAWEEDMLPPLQKIKSSLSQTVDVDQLLKIARLAPDFPPFKATLRPKEDLPPREERPLIAYARDRAFQFYYGDNLTILENMGARLAPFSPLDDEKLPEGTAGVYIGGGFPELYARQLSENHPMLEEIRRAAREDVPILAECGGLMYLTESIETDAPEGELKRYPMGGIIPGRIVMGDRMRTLGYCDVTLRCHTILARKGSKLTGHFFHWSRMEDVPEEAEEAFDVLRRGNLSREGFVYRNVLATYLHLHFGTNPAWARNFVKACDTKKAVPTIGKDGP
ncbi:MAG: cobyrinate a,c-diamide synthase [Spirochaetales bacterium]|nr:cobyrinate a,c-diamide synthase [Spirochaetales bacterium]